eukprot:GFUD01029356.1.p1 GENE.GFUD01029356.1~~GFUD01029356.1.p1  ORF type:complete len:284 (-),score=81.30 GFUD01029356.1:207-1058(-)
MAVSDTMSLVYTNHSTSLTTNLTSLLLNQLHCDVVLACRDGLKLSAHKIILSACSTYFRDLLADTDIHQETIIVLRDIDRIEMKAILDFVYSGTVSVARDRLKEFLSAANSLQIEELIHKSNDIMLEIVDDNPEQIISDTIVLKDIHTVKIEPDAFLDVMKSEPIEAESSGSEVIKVEPHEEKDTKPEGACTLQIRTDIIIPEPPPLSHHHHNPAGPDPPINFPETAQELVRNRIFGWNQKRALQNIDSAEKILTKKPCVCTQCGARFSYRNQLTEHKRNAHD